MDRLCIVALVFALACGTASPSEPGADASVDTAPDAPAPQTIASRSPAVEGSGACEGLAAYEPHERGNPVFEWSALHADVRFFGVHQSPYEMDGLLVNALGGEGAEVGEVRGDDAAFQGYAAAGPETCFVGAWEPLEVPQAVRSDLQWFAPGRPVALASTTEYALVDLRSAAEGPALEAFLADLLDEVIEGEFVLRPHFRIYNGMRDEAWAPTIRGREGNYRSTIDERPMSFRGTGAGVPLGFVVGERLAPSAARFVLAMRAAGAAHIVGQGISTQGAEYTARPAGSGGFLLRAMLLRDGEGTVLPDLVPADLPLDEVSVEELEASFVADAERALPALTGEALRTVLEPAPRRTLFLNRERNEGTRQAALLIVHGASALFFPYWDVVDSEPDARLLEALALEPRDEEPGVVFNYRSLRFFSHALEDSHGFTWFGADAPMGSNPSRRVPILLDSTPEGEPVVRLSDHPDFRPGDVIEAVDGVESAELSEANLEYAASSASSAQRNGLNAFYFVGTSRDYLLRDPSGGRRTVTVLRDELDDAPAMVFPNYEQGRLADRGHPELLYVDLAADAISGPLTELERSMRSSEGVIFDMRGYPGPNSWRLINQVLGEGSRGPQMRLVYRSVLESWARPTGFGTPPAMNAFDGPVVILTAPTTQSQAEHLVLTLQAAERVTVIGRPSAGANGDITSVALPGGYAQSFTGMRILQPDESVFHGVGVRVDELIAIEPSILAEGIDPELQRAIELLAE